jgi:hypothetical protein
MGWRKSPRDAILRRRRGSGCDYLRFRLALIPRARRQASGRSGCWPPTDPWTSGIAGRRSAAIWASRGIVIVASPAPRRALTSGRPKLPSIDWARPRSGRRCSVVAYGNRRVSGMSGVANSRRQGQRRITARFPKIRIASHLTFAKDAKQTSLTRAHLSPTANAVRDNSLARSRGPFDNELVHSVDMRACKFALWGGPREYSAQHA